MRFMILHKTNAHWEGGALPTRELIARVGAMIGGLVQSGQLLAGEGLRPSSQGVRARFVGGKRTVSKGPFTQTEGNVEGFAILSVKSIDEALECVSSFAALVGDVEIDIRPLTEAWDLGVMEKPADLATQRFMAAHKTRGASGAAPTPQLQAAMGKLIQEMSESGTLLSTEGFPPTSTWSRLKSADGRHIVVDGPFTESKELIGGFVTIEVKSKEEAIDWLRRYADVVGAEEIDLIPLSQV
jgi:hypothetical protein